MLTEFENWLKTVCTPERVEVIREGWDLIESVEGPGIQEIQLNLFSMQGIADTFDLLSKVSTELAFYSAKTLDQFQIFISDDEYTQEQQSVVNAILGTVLHLDQNELPKEILDVCRGGESNEEILGQLVANAKGIDVEDVLVVVESVSKVFIERVILICEEKIQDAIDGVEPTKVMSPRYVDWVQSIFAAISDRRKQPNQQDPVLAYGLGMGKLGLPLPNYVVMFANLMTDVKDPLLTAERWIVLAAYSNIEINAILDEVTAFWDTFYSDINETMALRKHVVSLLNLWRTWL